MAKTRKKIKKKSRHLLLPNEFPYGGPTDPPVKTSDTIKLKNVNIKRLSNKSKVKAYKDSLDLYNKGEIDYKNYKKLLDDNNLDTEANYGIWNNDGTMDSMYPNQKIKPSSFEEVGNTSVSGGLNKETTYGYLTKDNKTVQLSRKSDLYREINKGVERYKKPTQPKVNPLFAEGAKAQPIKTKEADIREKSKLPKAKIPESYELIKKNFKGETLPNSAKHYTDKKNRFSDDDLIKQRDEWNKFKGRGEASAEIIPNYKAQGGQLNNNTMANDNLLTEFNAGGSHEANPFGGVQQGIGANGQPNMVEQGETKSKDYVFSDRIILDEASVAKYGLPKKAIGKTMAEASKIVNKQYKGDENNKIDRETSKEMIGRLTAASEEVRAQMAPQQPPQQQLAYGGKMNIYEEGGFSDQWEGMDSSEKAGGIVGGATALFDMGKTAFGKTGVDQSGMVDPDKVDRPSTGGMAASGALKGAAAGAAFGPWGAAIGGVLGGAAGLIGGGKANREAEEASQSFDVRGANMANFAYGGNMRRGYMDPNDGYMNNSYAPGGPFDPVKTTRLGTSAIPTPFNRPDAVQTQGTPGLSTINLPDSDINRGPLQQDIISSPQPDDSTKKNPLEYLRYASPIANAYQLATMKKPEGETLDRLDARFKPNQVDEQTMLNRLQRSGNINEALANTAGGSQGALRANLLGANINKLRGTSDAYLRATDINRAQDVTGQQFDLGVDRTNLQQSNLEGDINAKNEAAFESNKSKFISAIAGDLGGVGTEELRKSYPELSGMDYDTMGRFIKSLKEEQATKKAKRQTKKNKTD